MEEKKGIIEDYKHGLVGILEEIDRKIQSAGAEPQRGEYSSSKQSISQERVLP